MTMRGIMNGNGIGSLPKSETHLFALPFPYHRCDSVKVNTMPRPVSTKATKDGMRKCSTCQEWKPLTHEYFYRHSYNAYGFSNYCRVCKNKRDGIDRRKRGVKERFNPPTPEGMKWCSKCKQLFPATPEYYIRDKTLSTGFKSYCKACASKMDKSWRARNDDYVRQKRKERYERCGLEYSRQYAKRNRPIVRLYVVNRRARRRSFPDTLTAQEWQTALEYFNHSCAVCGRPAGFWHTLVADHWIPLTNPSCTGTIATNIVPLCHGNDGCNNSKSYKDPVEWLHATYGKKKGDIILAKIMRYFEWVKDEQSKRNT